MARRKKSKKTIPRRRRALWALGAAGVIFAFLAGLWWGPPSSRPPAPPKRVHQAAPAPKPKPKPKPHPQASRPTAPPVQPAPATPKPALPLVAIIIDDMGHGTGPAKRLAALGLPLTFSILPHAAQAKAVAHLAHDHGLEVMLHLPMEPKGYPERNPGRGVLLRNMSREELLSVLREDLARVPLAKGVNNHMGSAFSLHAELLGPVLLEIKARGMFYLDSFTSADSQGLATAQRLGLRTGRRDVFLDHKIEHEAIEYQMRRLLAMANERGRAVAIGHPHDQTIQVLQEWAPRLHGEVRLVTVSQILAAASGPGQGY